MSEYPYDENPDEGARLPVEAAGEPDSSPTADDDAADTRPKPPPGLHEAIAAQGLDVPPPPPDVLHSILAAQEPPRQGLDDTAPGLAFRRRSTVPPVLFGAVMVGMICLCAMLVSVSGFAGYRDGLATNDAQVTRTLATGIAEQYAIGVDDLRSGYAELAAARFAWIVETIQPAPEYLRDSPQLLALARTIEAASPTPPPTPTETPSPTPTATPLPEMTDTPSGPDPAALYNQAAAAMRVTDYEGAIEWLESLRALAPDYRPQETLAMYLEALTTLGRMYLRGQNPDGEDRLARGVYLIYLADDIGTLEPPSLLYEADFAERYLNARNYINGGHYAAALPVLEQMCAESTTSCDWSYRGISVRDLLEQAQNNTP